MRKQQRNSATNSKFGAKKTSDFRNKNPKSGTSKTGNTKAGKPFGSKRSKFDTPIREKNMRAKTNLKSLQNRNAMEEKQYDDYVVGVQGVKEALLSKRSVNRVMVAKSRSSKQIREILELARENKVVIQEVDPKKISEVASGENHQGIIAYVSPYSYSDFDEVLQELAEKEYANVIVLDHITDVHNLGSIIRTADAVGTDLIIIPSRRSALVNSTVSKTSAGAVEHVKIAVVSSLASAIKSLQKQDFWVYAADMDGNAHYQNVKYAKKSVIVVGSEESGISSEVRKASDQIVKIDMIGKVNSLNVSVAAALLMYQVKNTKYSKN